MEEDCVLVDVLKEILLRSLLVTIKLDLAFIVIEVEHRVQRMIVQPICRLDGLGAVRCRCLRRVLRDQLCLALADQGCVCRVQNRSIPFLTLPMSSSVPKSSKR
jgi:hypothetical protein